MSTHLMYTVHVKHVNLYLLSLRQSVHKKIMLHAFKDFKLIYSMLYSYMYMYVYLKRTWNYFFEHFDLFYMEWYSYNGILWFRNHLLKFTSLQCVWFVIPVPISVAHLR